MKRIPFLIISTIFLMSFHIGCMEDTNREDPDKITLHLEEVLLETNITRGSVHVGGWDTIELDIFHYNMTNIEFHLNSSSNERYRDEFILEIIPPDEHIVSFNPSNKSEPFVDVRINCKIQEMKTVCIINQTDLESYTNEEGCGTWTFKIDCIPTGAPWEEEWGGPEPFTLEVEIYGYRRQEPIN